MKLKNIKVGDLIEAVNATLVANGLKPEHIQRVKKVKQIKN